MEERAHHLRKVLLCAAISVGAMDPVAASIPFTTDAQLAGTVLATSGGDLPSTGAMASAQVTITHEALLSEAWKRHLVASIRLGDSTAGCPVAVCGSPPAADWSASMGYSHYAYGQISFGRHSSLSAGLAQSASAFVAGSIGSDHCDAILSGACPRLRPFNLTWVGPRFGAWTPSLQVARGSGPQSVTGRIDIDLLGGRLMAAWLRRADGSSLAPIGLTMPIGRWRLLALRSTGDRDLQRGQHGSVGLSTPLLHGEWRLQVSSHRDTRSDRWRKVATGYERALDFHRSWQVDVVQLRRADGSSTTTLGLGLRWAR